MHVPWSIVNIHEAINIHARPVQRESFKEGKTERNDIGFLLGYISLLSAMSLETRKPTSFERSRDKTYF